jgi:hypothetical protein
MFKQKMLQCAAIGFLLLFSSATKAQDSAKNVATVAKPKLYRDIITDKAITQKGLFSVHRINERYFFEIPVALFDKDILIISRIVQAAGAVKPANGQGYSGDKINENVVQFTKGPNNKIFIKKISFTLRSKDSSDNGMYRSVVNSNLQPIAAAFDIKAYSDDRASAVIDLTDYINGDNPLFSFENLYKAGMGLGAIQNDKSYTEDIHGYPENIEVQTVKTFLYQPLAGETFTYAFSTSIMALPSRPMRPRMADDRVGYFYQTYLDFDKNPQALEYAKTILKWRLEPGDTEMYKKGTLVEPKKPIVFYIDPATPKKWVPYLIQGVNDWQKAFEKAGFTNAIYAREAPTRQEDSTWSLEDVRYSAIVYKPSLIQNASGPNVHDPRTGEILESHINWYHNVMKLLHDWYFVQASPSDPRARTMEFNDSLMGQLIRFVSSHEVGHTLGLLHNFGASSTVPVDSLRNKKWVEENGFCPSIMDYARFNYVAQPGDGIGERGIFPRIGAYDNWAIEWGYKWVPAFQDEKEQKRFVNNWIIERTSADKRLFFGSEGLQGDPRSQSEDLGDDAVKAGNYGIRNLAFITSHLQEWTTKPGENYEALDEMFGIVTKQYQRYLNHVIRSVGGRLVNPGLTADQPGKTFEFVNREQQKKAIQFLHDQLFITPLWLTQANEKLFALKGGSNFANVSEIQKDMLEWLLSHERLFVLLRFESNQGEKAYTPRELFTDLNAAIWGELKQQKPIDLNRRALQKIYANQLITLVNSCIGTIYSWRTLSSASDELSLLKSQVKGLVADISKALHAGYKDGASREHLQDIKERLLKSLDPNAPLPNLVPSAGPSSKSVSDIFMDKGQFDY